MGIPGSANLLMLGGGAQAYQIEQSLRFDKSQTFTRTHTLSGSTQTISFWIKRTQFGTGAGYQNIFFFEVSGASQEAAWWASSGDPDEIYWRKNNSADFSGRKFRDPSGWYHLVFKLESSVGSLYANGELVNQITASGNITGSALYAIGAANNGTYQPMDGYIAEYHHVDGSALDPTDFGEYDDNGVWRPIEFAGSHGSNGFYLKFDPSATNGIGHDHSGNGNNFTATGFSTSGTGTDVMSDTPTTNWCTMNPLDNRYSSNTLSDGNLKVSTPVGANYAPAKSTFGVSSGKWYWECNADTLTSLGILQGEAANTYLSGQSIAAGYVSDGRIFKNASVQTNVATFTATDTLGFALDLDNLTIAFYKNNTLVATVTALTAGTYFVAGGDQSSDSAHVLTFNFGQRAFAYTPPTGYSALNTANLPAPDIADGSDYFQTVLYQGNDPTGQDITVADNSGNSWQPDFVWIKARGVAYWHRLFDSVRGATKQLYSNDVSSEATVASGLTSFNSDGFTLGSSTGVNQNTYNFVSWNWKAGGSSSSNTAGSITSTVSANPTAGFSIVAYTGNGTSGATIGHGLGVSPSMIVVKLRETSTDGNNKDWAVYHAGVDASSPQNYVLTLNSDVSRATSTGSWNNTAPSSTVFTVGNNFTVNNSGKDYIAYCFAEVENYLRIGSYTGNGSSDGPFAYCGFRPAYLLFKRTDAVGSWFVRDAARDPYNGTIREFYLDAAGAEYTVPDIDFLSNGFKIRVPGNYLDRNASGGTYLFMAFAENPFGGGDVSPATAR